MKKNAVSFFLCLIGYLSFGQVSYGLKSGINIATTRDLIAYPRNRLGWYAGGFAVIPIRKNFFLQTELIYSSKGNRSYNQIGPWKIITRLNYLNLPILLGYKIDQKTSLLFGPEFGYKTSAYTVFSNGNRFDDSKHYPPDFDLALAVGISHKATKNVSVEIRYNYGFKTLYYVDEGGIRHSEIRGGNRVFQIGIRYKFNK